MAFITDKEKLKSGLIIFRRGDVAHRNFYCRIKLPKEDRYKTIALGTADRQSAHDQAFDLDADIRFRIKHDVPVFNRPFRQVAEEYIAVQQRRAKWPPISPAVCISPWPTQLANALPKSAIAAALVVIGKATL